jgi:hypothetical protein
VLARATTIPRPQKFVDYATHHLVEGLFIGDEAEAEAALVEAAAVLKEASDPSSVQPLNDEAQSLSALLADWLEYRDAPHRSRRMDQVFQGSLLPLSSISTSLNWVFALERFSIRLGVSRVCEISFAFFFRDPFEK